MDWPGFVGGSVPSQGRVVDSEQTINWYPEPTPSRFATQRAALMPTPGVTEMARASAGPGRAHFYLDGREFAVVGSKFIEIDLDYNITYHGTVAVDENPATISSNGDGGNQLFITSGTNGYSFDLTTNTLAAVASMAGKATMADFMDGYFFALDAATSTMYASDLLDATSWDTSNGQQRNLAADKWVALKRNGTFLWLYGTQTSEAWYDAGNSPFPLAPHPSGLVQRGCIAPFSVTLAESTLLWLDQTAVGNGSVMQSGGFTPEDVSNFAIQNIFATYPVTSDAIGESYQEQGHTFYLLSFPTANVTWCYDLSTGLWHERGTWISEQNTYTVWRPRFHALAFGEHRMLDSRSGAIYRMSVNEQSDVDGRPIRRFRRPPAITQENQRVFVSLVELDMEPATGLLTGQGEDPQIFMRVSTDGGFTHGPEVWRSPGKRGHYDQRVRWTRCGSGRRFQVEFACTDPVPWIVSNCYIQVPNASILQANTGQPGQKG